VPNANDLDQKVDLNLPQTLQVALDIAKQNNLDLLIAQLDYKISQKELNIEKAKLSPSASINYSKSKNNDFSSTIDKLDQETVKATITWPIVKGGKNLSSVKKSSLVKQRFLLLSEDVENKVITNTTNVWSRYQSSQGVLLATEAQLKAAEIANEGIVLEYDSGNTRSTLEVIQSTSLLLDARISFAKAERDFIISKFELAFQLGALTLQALS
jgi:outer membrane protein